MAIHPIFEPIIEMARGQVRAAVAEGEVDRLKKTIADLSAMLEECKEYFDNQSDVVDGDYGQPAPNKEMALAQDIHMTLCKAQGKSPW